MIKKEVGIGFAIGIASNIIGIVLYVLLFSDRDVLDTLRLAYEGGFLGSLIALGALLNLMVFFWYIRKRKDRHARGVLMATVVVALLLLVYKLFL